MIQAVAHGHEQARELSCVYGIAILHTQDPIKNISQTYTSSRGEEASDRQDDTAFRQQDQPEPLRLDPQAEVDSGQERSANKPVPHIIKTLRPALHIPRRIPQPETLPEDSLYSCTGAIGARLQSPRGPSACGPEQLRDRQPSGKIIKLTSGL